MVFNVVFKCLNLLAEEISGIFIKSIAPDSVADRSKMIQVNDQIIEVDGRSLYRYNNMQAVDLLRSTSTKVKLKLARYMKGNKYDKINEGVISASDTNSMGTNTAAAAVGAVCMNQMNGATVIQINHSSFNPPPPATNVRSKAEAVDFWSKIVGPEYDIIVSGIVGFNYWNLLFEHLFLGCQCHQVQQRWWTGHQPGGNDRHRERQTRSSATLHHLDHARRSGGQKQHSTKK